MVSKKEMQVMIKDKAKEVENAERYFNQCSQEDIELANMRLTVVCEELDKLIRESKKVFA